MDIQKIDFTIEQKKYLARIAHDLNNPLSIIQGNLELMQLKQEQGKLDDSEFKRLTTAQQISLDRAFELINLIRNQSN